MDTPSKEKSIIADQYSPKGEKKRNKIRLFKTVMLVFPFAAMGMCHSIQYTTIPDMRVRLDATTQQLSYAMSVGSAGGLIGGPLGSITDRFSHFADMIISLTLIVIGGVYSLFPFSGYVYILAVLNFIFSLGWGLYQASAHSVITNIWGTEGGPARFAIHFGYPIGSMIGPLIAIPFVSDEESSSNETTAIAPTSNNHKYDHIGLAFLFGADIEQQSSIVESKLFDDGSSIEYAYLIVGLFTMLLGTVFMVFQLFRKCLQDAEVVQKAPEEERSFRQVLSPKEWADGDSCFGLSIFILMIAFYVLQTATMKGTQEYLVTYAVDSGMFSNQEAATLNSVVYASGAAARAIAIVVSKYIAIPYLLFIEVHGQLLFGVLCLIFGTQSSTALWILAPCLGFFRELMWPSGYAWTDYYIILLGVVVGLLDMICSTFNIFLISLQGYLYDNTVIESIFYTTVLFGFLLCLNTYAMTYYASRKGGRKARAAAVEKEELIFSVESVVTKL